ncbi:unnamed protein product [Calicophoron daubneyi]|uniref:Uncharacterized protein n=1 Tax=Calicophoron daubneyi TaxID=300641 RepID=A0AAV2T2C0_CALDB
MRTRHRGQRSSFVASLGLCPRSKTRQGTKSMRRRIGLRLSSRGRLRQTLVGRGIHSTGSQNLETTRPKRGRPPKASRGRRGRGCGRRCLVHYRIHRGLTKRRIPARSSRNDGPDNSREENDFSSVIQSSSSEKLAANKPRRGRPPSRKRQFPGPLRSSHIGLRSSEDSRCQITKDVIKVDDTSSPASTRRSGKRLRLQSPLNGNHELTHKSACTVNKSKLIKVEDRRSASKQCLAKDESDKNLVAGLAATESTLNFIKTKTIVSDAKPDVPVPLKRRRGRPPLNRSRPILADETKPRMAPKNIPPTIFSGVGVRAVCTLRGEANRVGLTAMTVEPERSPLSVATDLLELGDKLRLGSTDEVLQGILSEINKNGVIPPISKSEDSAYELSHITGNNSRSENSKMMFDDPVIEKNFESIWNATNLLLRLDIKDLFLALNGLLRPGVCELWRRRREDQSKQLKRGVMGRLRPNPRPRRYSDMVISNINGSSVANENDSHSIPDSAYFTERIRQTRGISVTAARLMAAKKLIRAKSRGVSSNLPSVLSKVQLSRSLRTSSKQSRHAVVTANHKSKRSTHPVSKLIPQLPLPSRTRRRPDVSHHIDWKFCYAPETKQGLGIPHHNAPLSRRRRRLDNIPVDSPLPDIRTQSEDKPLPEPSWAQVPCESDELIVQQEKHHVLADIATNYHSESEVPGGANSEKQVAVESSTIKHEGMNRPLTEREIEGRKKRKHALTVQRKRPVDRVTTSVKKEENAFWQTDQSVSRQLEDDSASSSNSQSGTVDAYGRSFRQARWYQHRSPRSSPSRSQADGIARRPSSATSSFDTQSKLARSLNLHRSRHHILLASPRRSIGTTHLSHQVTHRHRISRRPDRMCQLTLLDRLVLGLNCSVSQNEEEIHIKQLHAEELNILTQRINRTGFFIQSLALRTNANNDNEYNIVLTFSPSADASARRGRCPATNRPRLNGYEESATCYSRSSSGREMLKRSKSRSRLNKHISRQLLSSNSAFRTNMFLRCSNSLISGYLSDSAVSTQKPPVATVRQVHSDTEEVGSHSLPVTYSHPVTEEVAANKRPEGQPLPVQRPNSKRSPRVVVTAPTEWPHSSSTHHPIEVRAGNESVSSHKRMHFPSKAGHESPMHQPDAQMASSTASGLHVVSASHILSKRPASSHLLASTIIPPFRRHSPRKIIRKVYTGSLTIPKILNRKRPMGTPAPAASASSCSVISNNSPGSSSTAVNLPATVGPMNACPNAIAGAAPGMQCLSGPVVPTMLFDDPNQQLSIYPQPSNPAFPIQYRRLQTSDTPTSLGSAPARAPEQSVTSFQPTSSVPSQSPAFNESRASTILRFRSVPASHAGTTMNASVNEGTPDDAAVSPGKNVDISEPKVSSERSDGANGVNTSVDSTAEEMVSDSEKEHTDKAPTIDSHTSEVQIEESSVAEEPESQPQDHAQKDIPECSSLASCRVEDEGDSAEVDDSLTPATSMSASQLLKLKRLHDETVQLGETRPSHPFPQQPTRVQSPSQQNSQAQPIKSETSATQHGQSPQLNQSQELQHQQQSTVLPDYSQLGAGIYSVPTNLTPSKSLKSGLASRPDAEDDDADDFELKNVNKLYDSNVLGGSSQPVPKSVPQVCTFTPTNPTPTVGPFVSIVDPIRVNSGPIIGFANSTRLQRFPFSVVRSPFSPSSAANLSMPFSPHSPGNLSPFRCTGTHRPLTPLNPLAPSQVATRVVVQNPATLTRVASAENICSSPELSGKPVVSSGMISISSIPTVATAVEAASLNLTGLTQSTTLPITSGPLKRTVVHKYHSFRKILPKSPEHPGSIPASLGGNCPTFINMSGFSGTSGALTQLPVVPGSNLRLFRTASMTHGSSISSETPSDTAYFVDVGPQFPESGGPAKPGSHNLSPASVGLGSYGPSAMTGNPAPQLLKSLLESDASKDSPSSTHCLSVSTATVTTSTNPTGVTSTQSHSTSGSSSNVMWNHPAHQSRGTWQLGKRAVSSITHRSSPDLTVTAGRHSAHGPSHSSVQEDSEDPVPPVLPPSIKLTPSSTTSRLQQLQQHYQRRQQMQEKQMQHSLEQATPTESK